MRRSTCQPERDFQPGTLGDGVERACAAVAVASLAIEPCEDVSAAAQMVTREQRPGRHASFNKEAKQPSEYAQHVVDRLGLRPIGHRSREAVDAFRDHLGYPRFLPARCAS